MENITGDIDQLLIDVNSWPHEPVNWSEKARMYNIRHKGHDSSPPNAGQMLKALLKNTTGVHMERFEKPNKGIYNS